MNIPEINSDLEISFSDQKILNNPELVELFKRAGISITGFKENNFEIDGFMNQFRRCLIDQDFEGLIQLGFNNYEPHNQDGVSGFDIISKLLEMAGIKYSAEELLMKAEKLNIQNQITTATRQFNERLYNAQEI